MASTDEPTLNVAMAEVLDTMRKNWCVFGQPAGKPLDRGRPDIAIVENGVSPVIVENEFLPAATVEKDAQSRLGADFDNRGKISTVIAVRVPKRLKKFQASDLRKELRDARDLEYAVYSPDRFPESGWITGGLANISMAAQVMAIPKDMIDKCVEILEKSISKTVVQINALDQSTKDKIAKELFQNPTEQTWRMVGLILSNALIFYNSISGRDGIKTIAELKRHGVITQGAVIEAWDHVLKIDYYAIFEITRRVLRFMEMNAASRILNIMIKSAEDIIALGMTRSFDLYGLLFQKMIEDRKLLAAFYTLPESAALLASLLLPGPSDRIWEKENMIKYKIADFACGTGTILTHVYKKMIINYGINGHDMSEIHAEMMESNIIGFDVIPLASHLTVSATASIFPKKPFEKTSIHTLRFGIQDDVCSLGSLDLIDSTPTFDIAGKRVTAKGEENIMHPVMYLGDRPCNLIAMNPPFGRNANHEGGKKDMAFPVYGAFNISIKDQIKMGKIATDKFRGTCANGSAGMPSNFIAIADKKLAKNGVMGMILPATVTSGSSWRKVRKLLTSGYEDIKIISMAKLGSMSTSFSSDTDMAEVMLTARKRVKKSTMDPRGKFISIYDRPESIIESIELGNVIVSNDDVRRVENGPHGGTPVQIGQKVMGHMLDCPLNDDVWAFVNVVDPTLVQCVYQLRQNKLNLLGQKPHDISITRLDKIGKLGPTDRSIAGTTQAPFNRSDITDNAPYPMLWSNDSKKQISVMLEPDEMATPKRNAKEEDIQKIANTATHLHTNVTARYTSQALCFGYTVKKTIGGRAWPSIILNNKSYEKALAVWGTSTLGILCFWSDAGKQQFGRGMTSRTGIISMPILDFDKLGKSMVKSFDRIFDKYANKSLLPMKHLYKDETRIEIDEKILEALGIDVSLDYLRRRFCAEPSVNGGKVDTDLKNIR